MKCSPLLTFAALATVLFFASCKNSGISDLPIPKDAAMVLHINTNSMTSKLSWKEIRETTWFAEMSKDTKDSFHKKLLENPEASGVDVKSDFALFMKKQGKGGYMVFEGKIKDESAFEKTASEMNKDAKIEKDGDLKYMVLDHNSLISWNSKNFFAISDAPFLTQVSPFGQNTMGRDVSFPADSLRKFTKELVGLSSSNSIEKNERFSDLVKEKGDMHFYMNSEQFTSGIYGGMMSMLKVNTLFKDNVATFTLNFDDGKISVKSKQYYGEEMAKLLDKYKSGNVSEALINRIPSSDVAGVLAFNFDPEGIREILKATGLDGMVNGFLGQVNYTLDELIQSMKGDFILAVTDFQMKAKSVKIPAYYPGDTAHTITSTTPDMKVIFANSLRNRQSFEKLIGIAEQQMGGTMKQMVKYKVTNDWFAASNDSLFTNQFLAGGDHKVPFANKISGHPIGMYIDIQRILKATQATLKTAYDSLQYTASINMWEDVIATGGEYKNNSMSGEFVINLVDKKTNSLKQLNQYGEKMAAAQKKRSAENMNKYMSSDSTTVMATPMIEEAPKTNNQ